MKVPRLCLLDFLLTYYLPAFNFEGVVATVFGATGMLGRNVVNNLGEFYEN